MQSLGIVLAVVAGLLFLLVALTVGCFLKMFYSPRRRPMREDEYPTPEGEVYEPYRAQMVEWIKEIRTMKRRAVSVTSHDGLTLRGFYYEHHKGAPIEVMFHGYRGTAERDLCGAVYRCFALGRSALIVDQRAAGSSDGHVISFGAKERYDCVTWVDFVLREIDPDAKIILTGISMGAATVMLASVLPLPKNVVGVLADCGYSSTKKIVFKVAREMHLPPALLYPFIRLGGRLIGGFDTEDAAPVKAMRECRLPIIFFHGDADAFVPCEMSVENYNACASDCKRLVLTRGAGHGLCFSSDQASYFAELKDFFDPILQPSAENSLTN